MNIQPIKTWVSQLYPILAYLIHMNHWFFGICSTPHTKTPIVSQTSQPQHTSQQRVVGYFSSFSSSDEITITSCCGWLVGDDLLQM